MYNGVFLTCKAVGVIGELLFEKRVDLTPLTDDALPLDLSSQVSGISLQGGPEK